MSQSNLEVNGNLILNQLSYFHVQCNGGLLPYIMHDLLVGALQYEVKLLLQVMIEHNYFTLEEFNSHLDHESQGSLSHVADTCNLLNEALENSTENELDGY